MLAVIPNTNVAGSPGWWFSRLAAKMSQRRSRLDLLARYMDGNAPLPEGTEKLKQSYQAFQRKARTNFGELVVEAVAERMTPSGFRVGDDGELSKDCDLIWSANELDVFANDVHSDMLGLSSGYVIVGGGDAKGVPIITREDPTCIVTAHDPRRPQTVIAALKMYRDDVAGCEFSYLYLPGWVMVAKRESSVPVVDEDSRWYPKVSADLSGWDWVSLEELPFSDAMPVVRFKNRKGLGEFETHTDILDRINYMVLQRLVITAMQAFRQRAVKGDMPETQETVDDDGNTVEVPVDYAELFAPGPGSLWMIPDGVELWESQVGDITQVLAGVKDDIRDLAAVTRTPMAMLLPDGQNQSAEGAQFAREGLVFKAIDRQQRAGCGWNQAMQLALRFMGKPAVTDMETLWLPAERRTLAERADAASKLTNILPFKTNMTDIMQFSPEKAEEMETERLGDILANAIGAPSA